MEFVKAMKIRKRMCKHYDKTSCCSYCELEPANNWQGSDCNDCNDFINTHPKEAEKILEEFDRNHPEKTILQDFLEKFPNAVLNKKGLPEGCCPYHLGYEKFEDVPCRGPCGCKKEKCWNRTLDELKERDS